MTGWYVLWFVWLLFAWWDDRLFGQMVGLSTGWLVGWLPDCSVGRLVSFVSWLADWMVGSLFIWLVRRKGFWTVDLLCMVGWRVHYFFLVISVVWLSDHLFDWVVGLWVVGSFRRMVGCLGV